MIVVYKSIYTIDYKNNLILSRSIPDYFNGYIEDLIKFSNENKNIRVFKPRSQSTQVITNIKNIVNEIQKRDINSDLIISNNEEIASRLLSTEIEAQERISRMGTDIKKGSIIQALLKFDDGTYKYLIAKVDYLDFIDDIDFRQKLGFSAKDKDIDKTCLFEIIYENGQIIIDSNAKIYLARKASYWADKFLELEEMRTNEINTILVFKEVEGVLKRLVKKKSIKDFTIMRNSLIGKLRTNEHIDYNTMIDELVCDYTPENQETLNNNVMDSINEKLRELPYVKNFDLQFEPVPSVIKSRVKSVYHVYTGIAINVESYVENITDIITSVEEPDGSRYIKIKTTDDETYNRFI